MKKILVIVAVVIVAGGLFWWSMSGSAPTTVTTSAPSETLNPGAAGGPTATGNSNPPTPTPTPAPVATGYKNGTFTGPVVDEAYGQVQVAVVIKGGKIVAVDVPIYPSGGGHTNEVSSISIPILKQEAIAAQSAQVDIVSGATQTSEAFQQSLSVALSQAS